MITGYGTVGSSATRVAFGDDAAVAGGLVGWDGHTPCFIGDAIADPLTGLAAAAAILGALVGDGAWVIEASMADIAGGLTGPPLAIDGRAPSLPRIGDRPDASVAALGADTARIMDELAGT
jgi:crotonobetainyl-CoA:carnitine CoA-transferase CaiB-like acyl-CoA transferase